jgi:hypothetical protein
MRAAELTANGNANFAVALDKQVDAGFGTEERALPALHQHYAHKL